MSVSYVYFGLEDGYLMNWLAAGPQAIPFQALPKSEQLNDQQETVAQLLEVKSGIINSAVERGPLNEGTFTIDGYQGEWNYYKSREDHLVDLSALFPSRHFVRAWAHTQLYSQAEQTVQFSLTTFGPVEVWINKKSAFRSTHSPANPFVSTFEVPIRKGANKIMICFASLAAPECILAFSLKAAGNPSQLQVRIPTLIPSIERRNELESVYDRLHLNRDVYAYGDKIVLHWPEDLEKPSQNEARLQTLSGRIYGQAEDVGKPGQQLILGSTVSLAEGPYQVLVMPRHWEYYESQIRITKKFDLWLTGANRFSPNRYGNLDERRREALMNAASREGLLFGEIAKMALGKWGSLVSPGISQAVSDVKNGGLSSCRILLGLLGAVCRYGNQPEFPGWIKEQVKEAAVNFEYGTGETAANQGHPILLYTCQVLAGQLYPEAVFSSSQLAGSQHRQAGESLAIRWMRSRGTGGFIDWDSRSVYADTLTALSYLIDLAKTDEVWELGSVLMDKMFFAIALNSFNGVFGSSQGWASSSDIKSGLLDPTAGITRLMWGMGIFNDHLAGTVSLACLENYELPPIIADIAAGSPTDMLNREQQGPVNKVTYRTPDFMLCSAQDYRPGQPGKREHVWQATLGPQAIVFTNHPGCSSENDAHVPNYWLGNGALPRITQWKDTLVALYKLPDNDIMGFTHAYFPTYEFDEYLLRDDIAFARKGDGYLALTSPNGINLIESGPKAFRELRSYGYENTWLCQMGRSSTDGTFTEFQEKVTGLNYAFDRLEVQVQTLRGDVLKFSWEGPLSINGEEQPLKAFKHFDNPYTTVELPCTDMEIKTEEYMLRLRFGDLPQE